MSTSRPIIFSILCLILLLNGGCEVAGMIAGKVLPDENVAPKYLGMAGQTIGVLVWTDRGVQIDYPSLGLDLANSIEKKMLAAGKQDELKKSTFPVQPASIVRYQQDHPAFDTKNITDLAPKLGMTRLIYVELEDFATRAPASVDLYRGSMTVTLKIVEVAGDKAKIAYEEDSIKAVYPPKVTEDGTPDGDDVRFYQGTVDAMSTQIVNRLVTHEEDDEQLPP
ncbi:MAG TPA: hypothetical protein VHS31_08040 [Tepidisphaeraceae bacterium]|jgi:hypothetical protein|nr:hypothetical protein [Tepidisphaeraceae bacterium]